MIVTTDYSKTLKITDIGNASSNPSNEEPLAQIVHWKWDEKGAQQIISVSLKNPFPAPSSSSTDHDELTLKIGDKQIAVSAHWLSSVSPVISRMLSVEMKEKQQRMITLDELGVDMDQFKQFLEAITYLTMSRPFLPNPKNVLMLLKLADYFQVTALKSRCETHLINCVEIPLIDRFLLIERFGLDNLKYIGNASKPPNLEPLAQIIRWDWDKNGAQRIISTQILNKGSAISFHICANDYASFVIRILKKQEKNPFPAPSSSSTDDHLTVKIGDKQIAVSAHWLSSVSPVISRMLSVEMKEKQQRMITLDGLGVDMDKFKQFLEAISYQSTTFLPNPKNVLMLLKLADYFQVTALKSCCEKHLINCLEIPLIDRFLLIERFGLDNLENYFLHLDVDKLRAFFTANSEQLSSAVIAVSAHWLMSVSPVISRMLSVEMKEKQQRMITLDELGVDMDQFIEFLEAICGHFLPNPKNVLVLLQLADYFQVDGPFITSAHPHFL
ncbi:hypothetical protein niasHT_023556 [Heterodera trifolii]|uniref:BTB domain-containing protein n=1 Tax=Heterodera trifolii TaxID=157864 RepID=A0ABD2JF02_9BILA